MSSDTDTDLSASLALLTPEERAAIAGDDGDPADAKALEAVIKGAEAAAAATPDGDEDETETEGGATDSAAAPAPAPAAAPAPAPAAAPAAAPAPAEAAAPTPADVVDDLVPAVAPVHVSPLPADFDAKVEGVKTELAALRQKFKDGDLDIDQYETEKSKLEEQRRELDLVKVRHDLARDQADQGERTAWATGVNNLYKAATKDGVDYAADEGKRADLDAMLKTLATRQENADKPMGWFLREAHRRVLALHDIRPAAGNAPAPAPAAAAPTTQRRAPPPVSAAQPSLAQVPGGNGPGDDGTSEYQHLDALEGDALEDALARMSPRDRDRYLSLH